MFLDRSATMGYKTPFLDSLGSLLDGNVNVEDAQKKNG